MATAAIGIICKAPKAGQSKTRLIPRLGPERAAALARAFLIDLSRSIEEAAAAVGCAGYAVCSPESAAAELATFLPPAFAYIVKTDCDLGRVLDGATQELLARGHESAILVNGDSPTLPAALLVETVRALRVPGAHAVFVPALDGGYSIVGLNRRTPEIFADIPWSTPAVMRRSLEQAERHAIPVEFLSPWYDVDDSESLDWLLSELRGERPGGLVHKGAEAPATRKVLGLES
ncbi:TIGR04282 family arsenosugar biosynthesis glycosyltransferase [Roseiarcus sp.]|uniref:TIGR04282 family arsenosugar biosynthesis glycosyltransferase n=1 Tax=Roseiarcus sp. TaxID=1969460 RepID=UPI003F9934B6